MAPTSEIDGSQEAQLRAIIFDFNGVVADDETPHLHCFQQALAEQGILLSREDYYGTYLGMDERTCAAALLLKRDGACDPMLHARIIERKATLFRDYTALHKPALFPWVLEFIQRAAGLYRLAVASGGRREQILSALANSAIERAFELIVSADECPVGKPDPGNLRLRPQTIEHAPPKTATAQSLRVPGDRRYSRRRSGGPEGRHARPRCRDDLPGIPTSGGAPRSPESRRSHSRRDRTPIILEVQRKDGD